GAPLSRAQRGGPGVSPPWQAPPAPDTRHPTPIVFEPMRTRPLGPTGYSVSELGFGAWGLGGGMWQGGSDGEARAALRAAVDQGITFFDTALAYGQGHSERLIGAALKGEIESGNIVVATKIPPRDGQWPGAAGT